MRLAVEKLPSDGALDARDGVNTTGQLVDVWQFYSQTLAVGPCMLQLKKLQCRLNPRNRRSFSNSQFYPQSAFIYIVYQPLV